MARVFPADDRAADIVHALVPNRAVPEVRVGDLVEAAVALGHPIDVYAYATSAEMVRCLARGDVERTRFVLRFPEGFDERVSRELTRHPRLAERTRVYDRPNAAKVHAKLFVIHLGDRRLVIVGSSNATHNGLWTNLETNVVVVVDASTPTDRDPTQVFETLWRDSETYDRDRHFIQPLVALDAPVLFEYQRVAIESLEPLKRPIEEGTFLKGTSVPGHLVSLPTAAGKTVVAIRFALEHVLPDQPTRHRRMLWISDTDEQVSQAYDTFRRQVRLDMDKPLHVLRLTAEWSGPIAAVLDIHDVVFTTRRLLASRLERHDERVQPFHLVVIDEAHHVHDTNTDYPRILGTIPHAARVGLSATPHRHPRDEDPGLYAYFNPRPDRLPECVPAFARELHEIESATHRGLPIFARAREEVVRTGFTIDLADIGRDENRLRQLRYDDPDRIERIAAHYRRERHGSAMLFAVDIADANALTRALVERGARAQAVHTGPEVVGSLVQRREPLALGERRDIVRALANGELDAIINVEVFIEGVDIPSLASVFLARPTFSPRVFLQMRGRALRGPAMNGTAECVIVECTENVLHESGRRALMTTERALGRERDAEAPSTREAPVFEAAVDFTWRDFVDSPFIRQRGMAIRCVGPAERTELELAEALEIALARGQDLGPADRRALTLAATEFVADLARRRDHAPFIRTRGRDGRLRFKAMG